MEATPSRSGRKHTAGGRSAYPHTSHRYTVY
jgi:hypothetical protein